ncbi:MAG: LysM peptidoglycan-binding domain-containing protein, partial [Bacilli bacterium]|nr:LysM peptidoglycan-binding domain-containing protein [Bacilli bacterium]
MNLYEWKEDINYDIKPSIYIVRKGDTLNKIAKMFNIPVEELDNNKIYPGQILIIDNKKIT